MSLAACDSANPHESCDWPENSTHVLRTLDRLDTEVTQLRSDVRDIRNWMIEKNGNPPVSEIVQAVEKSLDSKRKSGHISRSDIEKMVREARNSANGKTSKLGQDWPPWAYVLMGAAIVWGKDFVLSALAVVLGGG